MNLFKSIANRLSFFATVIAIGAASVAMVSAPAHAGLLDELLKNPNIQGLVNRPDLGTLIAACRDVSFRQANAANCSNVETAAVLNRLPLEMRAIMNNPQTAASLREICAAVAPTQQANSYLCVQLRNAEAAVGILAKPVTPAAALPGSRPIDDSNKY